VLAKSTYMTELRGRQAGQLPGRQPIRDAKTSLELSEILYWYTHVSATINFYRAVRKFRQPCLRRKSFKNVGFKRWKFINVLRAPNC